MTLTITLLQIYNIRNHKDCVGLLFREANTVHPGSLVERVEFVGLVVAVVPPLVVIVDVLPSVGGVLAADHEEEGREHGDAGDSNVQADAEMVAGPFHHVAPVVKRATVSQSDRVN